MKATEFAAWWGAAIATLVLLWDIYKWERPGPRVLVTARPNMKTLDNSKLNVFVEATNLGDRPTTLTHFSAFQFKTVLHRVRMKPSKSFIIPWTTGGPTIPHTLSPGERWTGLIDQASLKQEIESKGPVYCGVYESGRSRPRLARIHLN